MLYLLWVFKDKWSWIVFIPVFVLSLWGFKIIPQEGGGKITPLHALLGLIYSLLLATLVTCLFKTIKEKLKEQIQSRRPFDFLKESSNQLKSGKRLKAVKTFSVGLLKSAVLLAGIVGLGAAQFCVFGSPVCGVSVGTGIVMTIFPTAAVKILYQYAEWIILGAVALQVAGLFLMGCFKRVPAAAGVKG